MHKEEKSFVKEKKNEKLTAIPIEKVTKKPWKIVQIHQVLLTNLHQSTHERIVCTEKTLQNTLLTPSFRDGNAIETLLMTAQINTDFVNHSVPSTTELSTSLLRVGTAACESVIHVTKTMIPIKMLTKIFKSGTLIILSITGVQFVIDYGLEMI
ncbi:uncharacterized protein TNCV_4599011 [Trichonephila clavipes]|nr:uncharacterized protein TNCV_4599011 [Trichonephila clavipes]